jgi:alpha-1,3-glucosyltransferase
LFSYHSREETTALLPEIMAAAAAAQPPPVQVASLELALCLAAILLRACVALHGYSGEASPPMFGDYEAQRHWMEVTVNLPPSSWYVDGPDNDLQYWGLDYPPLSAYFSWAIGRLAALWHPQLVVLHSSRGHESPASRAFMRRSVLLTDVLVFFPAAIALAGRAGAGSARPRTLALVLLCPALILVDHGHFQYNCASLGLAAWAFLAATSDWPVACCVAFSLSLNFKQMGLYLAPAVFCYLMAGVVRRPTRAAAGRSFAALGLATSLTFAACWAAFLPGGAPGILAVLSRVFPTSRGLYEDKVASVWCTLALLPPLKLKARLPGPALVRLTAGCTLCALVPPCALLLRRPSRSAFAACAAACGLAFFLLSFQVHEKHILLPLLPAGMLAPRHPRLFGWFSLVATFSMFPLLARDGLRLAYAVCQLGYAAMAHAIPAEADSPASRPGAAPAWLVAVSRRLHALSLAGMVGLHLAEATLAPPRRYPDIHAVAFSAYACAHFVGAYLLLVWWMWRGADGEVEHTPLDGGEEGGWGAGGAVAGRKEKRG